MEEFKDLVKKLLEPIPDTVKEVQEDTEEAFVCPYVSYDSQCHYYSITGQKPTRLDCYICRREG